MEERDENIGIKNVKYSKTILLDDYIKFSIPIYDELFQPTNPTHPFYNHYSQNFDKSRLQYANPPIHVGPFEMNTENYTGPNVLRVPIKISGNRDIILPKELEFFKDYIEYCCIYENCFNPKFTDYFIHMTVDKKFVNGGETQRVPGWHVDGFQGSKFPEKHTIEHSYLWCDNIGTEFCIQPFFVNHIDESKYLLFDEFEKQVSGNPFILSCMTNNVYIFDPYMVHRSPMCKENTTRTLVRLTFETEKLLDPNDTINPNLKFDTPYKYDIRNRLGTFPLELDTKLYGFEQ